MSLGLLIVLTVFAVLGVFVIIPLIAMMAGGSKLAIVQFGLAMILPITAVSGWVVYLSNAAAREAGVPYGWLIGLVIVAGVSLTPRLVLTPAAKRVANSFQEHDIALTPIEPKGTIAVQTSQFKRSRRAAPDKPALVARLIAGGFDGVLLIDTHLQTEFEYITLAAPGEGGCEEVLDRALAEQSPDITEEEWDRCFRVEMARMDAADVAFVEERESFTRRKIAGLPHTVEVFRERVVRRGPDGWRDVGQETWVKHDTYRAPVPIASGTMLRPSPDARSVGLRGVLPTIWPGFKTPHDHPPQNVTAPIPALADPAV